MFKPWKADTEKTWEDCAEEDFKHWKIPRICKDPEDLENVKGVVRKYYSQLKHIFYSLISCEEYPHVGWMNFTEFSEQVSIIDAAHHVDLATIDRTFIVTNYDDQHVEGNPVQQLCRYEFMEILVRLAGEKFKRKRGPITTFAEAFETFLNENVLLHCKPPAW